MKPVYLICAIGWLSVTADAQTFRTPSYIACADSNAAYAAAYAAVRAAAYAEQAEAADAAFAEAAEAADAAADAAAYAADAAAAYAAAHTRDRVLADFAERVVQILVEMGAPGAQWLDLSPLVEVRP